MICDCEVSRLWYKKDNKFKVPRGECISSCWPLLIHVAIYLIVLLFFVLAYHLLWTSSEDIVCQYLTTQLGLPRGLQHTMPYIVKSSWHLVVQLGLVVLVLAGQTNFTVTADLSLQTSGARPYCMAMVEQHDSPSWLRDENDLLFLH